jgi:putative Holliday junction resolvase
MSPTQPTRILGVDFGRKRVGLAISDETGTVAQSIGYVPPVPQEILRVATARGAGRIVVGVPRRLDGTNSEQTDRALAFARRLEQICSLPVEGWDERLTTVQAERVLLEGNVSRKKRREKIDALAAQLMLQNYLDARAHTPTET